MFANLMTAIRLVAAVVPGVGLTTSAIAQEAAGERVPSDLRNKLVMALEVASENQLQIVDIKTTPLPDIFEVELNTGELLYSDASGDYLFAGDMYRTTPDGLMNLSSTTRQSRTSEKIAAIPESEMIVFTPERAVRAAISVFTDVDCTYCRALHRDLETLLEMGIEVRYLAYPRGW